MIIDYYHTDAVSVNTMLKKGIAAGAYNYDAGWIFKGLIRLSREYGLDGHYYDMSKLSAETAVARFRSYVQQGPVILPVHYKFDPKNPIPHLVVIDGIKGDVVYYNDPATDRGEKQISMAKLLKAWRQKVIVILPANSAVGAVRGN